MILLTGATGNVGKLLAKLLTDGGFPFRAMVRSVESARSIDGLRDAEVVSGDFDDPESLSLALEGVERAFLLTNSTERAESQQLAFVEAASQAGVKHVVKLSQLLADSQSPVRFLRYHAAVENAIHKTDMAYTFLRPNLFMQGLLALRQSIVEQGKFFAPAGDARVSAIDIRDIAEAAAAALTDERHQGQTYDLTGPAALMHADMAESLSDALGRRIEFVNVPGDVMRDSLVGAGFPAWQADGLIEDYAHYRRDEASMVTSGVLEATGQKPRTFSDFARDYAPAFS